MPEIMAELAPRGPVAAPFDGLELVADVEVPVLVLPLLVADTVGVAVGEAELG